MIAMETHPFSTTCSSHYVHISVKISYICTMGFKVYGICTLMQLHVSCLFGLREDMQQPEGTNPIQMTCAIVYVCISSDLQLWYNDG